MNHLLTTISASLLFAFSIVTLNSCENNNSSDNSVLAKTTGIEKFDTAINYSDAGNWLSNPSSITKNVDLIYFYPTAYNKTADTDTEICDIDNAGMRRASNTQFNAQATAFEESCNLFAPYYRQVDATYALTLTEAENDTLIRYMATKDPAASLDYYFENLNGGRPFFLAGHSQGAEILIMLLSDYMKAHPEYLKNMIAAYPIGFSVTKEFLAENTHLRFAEGATDTGVIVSWNTEGPNNKNQHNAVVRKNSIAINPINWKKDATYASVAENLGMYDNNTGTIIDGVADAKIDVERGVVVCESVDPAEYAIKMTEIFGPESYHGNDYGFYYMNIRKNAADRITAWGEK